MAQPTHGYAYMRKDLSVPVYNGKETHQVVAISTAAAALVIPAGAIGMLCSTTAAVITWVNVANVALGGARVVSTGNPLWFAFDRSSGGPNFWVSGASASTIQVIYFYD